MGGSFRVPRKTRCWSTFVGRHDTEPLARARDGARPSPSRPGDGSEPLRANRQKWRIRSPATPFNAGSSAALPRRGAGGPVRSCGSPGAVEDAWRSAATAASGHRREGARIARPGSKKPRPRRLNEPGASARGSRQQILRPCSNPDERCPSSESRRDCAPAGGRVPARPDGTLSPRCKLGGSIRQPVLGQKQERKKPCRDLIEFLLTCFVAGFSIGAGGGLSG